MSQSLRVADYLDHILRALERISRYTDGLDEAAFFSSELVQDAVIRNIEIVGEAANKVLREAPDFAARNADMPWQVMYAMRNRVAHGYDTVDLPIVWKTVQQDLPRLYADARRVRAALPE